MFNCTNCGSSISKSDNFCMNCGKELGYRKEDPTESNLEDFHENHESQPTITKNSLVTFYFSLNGRISRPEYFFKALVPILLMSVFLSIAFMLFKVQGHSFAERVIQFLMLGIVIIQVITSVKRCHDFNKTGWWLLLFLIPIINIITLCVLLFKTSDKHSNKYGRVPVPYKLTSSGWLVFFIQMILLCLATIFYNFLSYQYQDRVASTSSPLLESNYAVASKDRLFRMPDNNMKWGFVDQNGNWVITPIYDDVKKFEGGLAEVTLNDKKLFIDQKGKIIIQPIHELFTFGYGFSLGEGTITFKSNGKFGVMDKQGNIIIQPKYDSTVFFKDGLADVYIDEKRGFIDKQDNMVIPPIYDEANQFKENLAAVKRNGKWGFIDKQGNTVIQAVYDNTEDFSEGLAAVEQNGKWGFINKQGRKLIAPLYNKVLSFKDGIAWILLDKKIGLINKEGETIIEPIFENFREFSEGLAAVSLNEKWGFTDKHGNIVVPIQYDGVKPFSEGLSIVLLGEKYGAIDKIGKMIVPPIYDGIANFNDGFAISLINERVVYLNREGEIEVEANPSH